MKICALDLATTSDGSALRSSVAKVNAEIVRDDAGGRRSYLLACERSYARFLTRRSTTPEGSSRDHLAMVASIRG